MHHQANSLAICILCGLLLAKKMVPVPVRVQNLISCAGTVNACASGAGMGMALWPAQVSACVRGAGMGMAQWHAQVSSI